MLAESKHAFDEKAFVLASKKPGALSNKDYGFFVLTMGRDLYMAKHRAVEKDPTTGAVEQGFYHSSYVAGDPVICSGTMLIVQGVIERIRFDSGHYQPHANNYRALVMALRMWNVPLGTCRLRGLQRLPAGYRPIQGRPGSARRHGGLRAHADR